MPALGLALGVAFKGGNPSGAEPDMRPVAYVSEGAAGEGTIGDPEDPFSSLANAIPALVSAHPGEPAVIEMQEPEHTESVNWETLNDFQVILASGLEIRAATTTTIAGALVWGPTSTENQLQLTIRGVSFTSNFVCYGNTRTILHAGLVTFADGASVAALELTGANSDVDGTPGSDGGIVTGTPGANGTDGEIGGTGENGGVGDATGGTGTNGGDGMHATRINLRGTGTIGDLYWSGGQGGAGGAGGNGGMATGGTGGNGGTSWNEFAVGGNGGSGGNALAHGGSGGNGGVGGNGAIITRTADITISNVIGDGAGVGGAAGAGGESGGATGGAAGFGGSGPMGTGFPGDNGTGYADAGSAGAGNVNGSVGSITIVF